MGNGDLKEYTINHTSSTDVEIKITNPSSERIALTEKKRFIINKNDIKGNVRSQNYYYFYFIQFIKSRFNYGDIWQKSERRNFEHIQVLYSEAYEGFTGKIIIPGSDSKEITKEIGPEKRFNCEKIDEGKCSAYEQYEIFGTKIRIEKQDKTHIYNLTQSDKLIVDKNTSKDWTVKNHQKKEIEVNHVLKSQEFTSF